MLYVSQETQCDVGIEEIVIKDSEDTEVTLRFTKDELWPGLKERDITPQTVVGLFKHENDVIVTPVTGVEMQVMKQLHNPHFYVADKLGADGASAYKSYGLYNYSIESSWGSPDTACSIAKLLLDTCGEVMDKEAGRTRLETTTEYIAVCVDNSKYQSLYLRFDIKDYNKVQRAYTKYKMMGMKQSIVNHAISFRLVEEQN